MLAESPVDILQSPEFDVSNEESIPIMLDSRRMYFDDHESPSDTYFLTKIQKFPITYYTEIFFDYI